MFIHLSRETRYSTVALSQKGNTCIQGIFTQSSVSMTTTPEYLPVSGFNVPSLHLYQSSRLHPFQVSQKPTATIRVMKVIPDLPVKLNNCPSSSQNMKTNSQQKFPVSFQVPIKTISTSYTVQVVSIDLIHALLKHFHNCSSNHGCYLMHLRNQDQHSQTGGVYMLSLYQSVVNQQSQHQVPPCLQCHDGSYFSLSLSALQCLYCQAKPHCFRLQFQGHQCKRPSSPTVPAHYRTSGVQLLTSYLQTTQTSHLTCGNPILSWTKVIDKAKIWPSRLSCHSFSFLLRPPGMTPGSVAPRTVHSVRPGSTTTWPTCRDVTLSHSTFLISF